MASLNDYLRSQSVQKDPDLENLLTSLGTYGRNVQVLQSLGAEKPTAEGTPGLASRLLRTIGAPGNLIRAGILEATGNPTPELARVSGIDQFKKLVSGEITTGFGQLPQLRSDRSDSVFEKIGKLGAAFTLDVATDPISYVGGAGTLSRNQAATLLTRTAGNIVPDIIAREKGAKALLDLVERSPRKAQERKLASMPEPVTTEELEKITPRRVSTPEEMVNEELGNYLAEGLLIGGRKEVINRLGNFTDNADEARAIYDKLPDEVKGGVALTNLLGVPIQTAPGQIARLTAGRGVGGPVGEVLNAARRNVSMSAGGRKLSEYIGGASGPVLSGAKKSIKERVQANTADVLALDAKAAAELASKPRYLDYVVFKDALGKQTGFRNKLTSASVAVAASAIEKRLRFAEGSVERTDFEQAFRDAVIGRPSPEAYNVNSEAAKLGRESGDEMRLRITEMQQAGADAGVPIGILGDPATTGRMWMPLILTPEAAARYKALHGASFSENEYAAEYGRNAFWVLAGNKFDPEDIMAPELAALAENREEILRAHGYPVDAANIDVIALDARIINKILAKKEETTKVKQAQFLEDPVQMFQIYSNVLANRISTKRFFDELQRFGVVTKDVARTRDITRSKAAALFLATVAKTVPELEAQAKELEAYVDTEIAKLTSPKGPDTVRAELAAARAKTKQVLDMADSLLVQRTVELDAAEATLDALRPTQQQLSARLRELEGAVVGNANEITARDRAARNARARAKTASENPTVRLIDEITNDFNAATDPAEKAFYASILNGATSDADVLKRLQRVQDTEVTRNLADAQLNAVRTQRKALRTTNVAGAQQFLNDFEQGILRRNAALAQLNEAKKTRTKIKVEYDNYVTSYGFEQVQAIDQFVDNLNKARIEINRYTAETKAGVAAKRVRGETKENIAKYREERAIGLAKLQADETTAVSLLNKLKNVAGRPSSKARASESQRKLVSDYIDNLIAETKDLSDVEAEAIRIIRSREKLEQLGRSITAAASRGELNDLQVQQLIGDLVSTFGSVRDKLRRRINTNGMEGLLTKEESKFLSKNYFKKFAAKGGVKETEEPSQVAKDLVQGGFRRLNTYNRAAANLYADSSVAKLLEDMYRAEANPTEWEKFVTAALDPLLMVWKQTVTLGRGPGYIATNVIGGLYNNYLGDVKMKYIKLAGSVMNDLKSEITKAENTAPTLSFWDHLDTAMKAIDGKYAGSKIGGEPVSDIIREFITYGGFFSTETGYAASVIARSGDKAPAAAIRGGTGYVPAFRATTTEAESKLEERFRKTIDFATTNKYMATMTDAAQLSEIFLRLAPFLDGFDKYRNFGAAMDKMYMLQYNYADLSNAEQWLRRIVPFYTWSRNNVPLQLRSIALQPGKIQRALYANQEFQNQFGATGDDSWINAVVPEFVTNSNGWVSQLNFADNNIGFFLKLPFEDINKLFYESGLPRPRELGNMLGPALKTPIEVLFGTNLGTGAAAAPGGEEVPGWYNLLRLTGQVKTGPEGETRANQALARTIQNFFPFIGTAERAAAGAAALIPGEQWNILFSNNQQKAGVSNLLNTIGLPSVLGYGTTTITPSSISGEVRKRTERQQYDIKSLSASGQIDTDWVREQLRSGRTSEEIALLIRSGAGQSKKDELSTLTSSSKQKYQDLLGQLGSP